MSDHMYSIQTGHGSVIARHLMQTLTVSSAWNESYIYMHSCRCNVRTHRSYMHYVYLQLFHLNYAHRRIIFDSRIAVSQLLFYFFN